MANEKELAQLRMALKEKVKGRLEERRKVQDSAGVSVGARQTLGNVVEQVAEELQSQENQCRFRREAEAADLFRVLRVQLLPLVVQDIEGGLTD